MKKKIIDILPPKREKEKPFFLQKNLESFTKRKFWKFLLVPILLTTIAFLIYLSSPLYSKATLYLTPKTEWKILEKELEINADYKVVDFEKSIIPGKIFKIEKEKEENFFSTGKEFIKEKAQGIIRVYNSHTPPQAITLRATTRFLSSEGGKIFRAPQRIFLPPAKVKRGKVIPSVVEVKVVAQQEGEEYNIGPSKFSLPGLAGTPFYFTIWAESEEPMRGGFKKEIKKVTEQDLAKAAQKLKENLTKLAKSALKNLVSQDYFFDANSFFVENFQSSCFSQAEEKTPEFNCRGKIKTGLIAFRLADLKKISKDYLSFSISSLKNFDEQGLELDYQVKNLLFEKGKIILDLKIKAKIYDKISFPLLLSQIKGKSTLQAQKIIKTQWPQIEKIKFEVWPFWTKKIPSVSERIKLKIIF